MTRILGIAWRVLKTNFSEPKVIVPMLLFPIAFTFIFGVLMLGGVNKPADSAPARLALGFTAEEQTPLALALRDELMRSAALKVREVDEETARAQVKDGKIIAGVVVPEGFAASLLAGDHPRVTLIRQDQSNLYLTASGEVERSIQRLASAVVAADMATADRSSTEWQDAFSQTLASWHEPGRDIEVVPVTRPSSGNTVSQGNITSIGFCVMFIMLSVLISAGVVLEERVAGTWQRLLATPARKVEVILGYLLGFFINGWAQMAILMVATRYLFGVRWGDPVGMIILTSVFIITVTALGLAVAGIVKTPQQQSVASNIGAVVTSMVAGVYWPYEMMPAFMQKIGLLMPQYWAVRGYQELLARGGDLSALGTPLLVLGGFAVVLLMFGVSRVRFE